MHKWPLSNTSITSLKLTKYVYVSEYATLYMNISHCDRVLNMPESAEIYQNVDKYSMAQEV